jgi:hypothetical protein
MGWLQDFGYRYAEDLMVEYRRNKDCASQIEEWRTRRTNPNDRDNIVSRYPQCANFTLGQRKQIVEYAKKYIYSMISDYWATHP